MNLETSFSQTLDPGQMLFRLGTRKDYAPVKVNPCSPPTWERWGQWTDELEKRSQYPQPQGNIFIPMALLSPDYLIMKHDIHFNHQFSSVNAWSTKGRKAGHLYAIKIEMLQKQYKQVKILDRNWWRDGKQELI